MLHADLVQSVLSRLLETNPVDLLLVQGDTSSALGGALAARKADVALGHVEAGLRSHDPQMPWPEEPNRIAIDRMAQLLFAPTTGNACNLMREQVEGEIIVTGSSGIDALAELVGPLPVRRRGRRWLPRRDFHILVTCHRRENWSDGLDRVGQALLTLADEGATIEVVLHPNPTVTGAMWRLFGERSRIRLLAPMSHEGIVRAMRRADLVLSDSGGMQEEAPALGVPLLVLRDKTERPEGLACGSMELVGNDPDRIIAAVRNLRRRPTLLTAMSRPAMPFGDGRAAQRIATHCLAFLEDRLSPELALTA